MVAFDLAKVDVRVRFPLPAPIFINNMLSDIGAVAIVSEEQKQSAYEMIRSFREFNPNSSIVIYADGKVDNINDIVHTFKCVLIQHSEKIGYPASYDFEIPLKYTYRFLMCSFLIREKYFINLEPDCLVKDTIKLATDTELNMLSSNLNLNDLQWSFYMSGDDKLRNEILPRMFEFYQKNNVCINPLFDLTVGGGGFIYKTKFAKTIINDWKNYIKYSYEIKSIYSGYNQRWYWDYLLSLIFPIYMNGTSYRHNENFNLNMSDRIIHPYKNFYV